MPTGYHIVHGPGNLLSTMLSERPWTLLAIPWARDPTAIELPEVLSNFSSLYSRRQFCCGNDKLKSPKMHCNVTTQGVCWLCFSNVAPLDFKLNCSTYLKESSTQTQRNTQLLAICLPSHFTSSSLIKPETMQCPWFYPTTSILLFLLPNACFTSYLLTAETQSRLVSFTDDVSDLSSSPEHHILSWWQYYTTSSSLVF